MIFIDTSALFALLDRDDEAHARARAFFEGSPRSLITHNYAVAETVALVHRRLGPVPARSFLEDLLPSIAIRWVDQEIHRAAVSAFLAAVRRRASLVDWVSFEIMRREGIDHAFTFDRDFAAQGFTLVP
ncbi:MAG: PIN domain-containing protein [Actinomycetota bacterium]